METLFQSGSKRHDVLTVVGGIQNTAYGKEYQRNGQGRNGGDQHVSDVAEQGNAHASRRQYGGFGKGRNLIAEIGAADDGSGNPSVAKSLCASDAHQGYSDGGNGGPRTTRHKTYQGTDDAGRSEENIGMDKLYSVADERRDNTADHPCAT